MFIKMKKVLILFEQSEVIQVLVFQLIFNELMKKKKKLKVILRMIMWHYLKEEKILIEELMS